MVTIYCWTYDNCKFDWSIEIWKVATWIVLECKIVFKDKNSIDDRGASHERKKGEWKLNCF